MEYKNKKQYISMNDNKKQEVTVGKIPLETVKVKETPDGGSVWIPFNTTPGMGMIQVTQRHFYMDGVQMKHKVRETAIVRPIEELVHYKPGDPLPGSIYIMEQISPIDYNDPLDMLAVDDDGTLQMYNGSYVWRLVYWSDSDDEEDQILIKDQQSTNR